MSWPRLLHRLLRLGGELLRSARTLLRLELMLLWLLRLQLLLLLRCLGLPAGELLLEGLKVGLLLLLLLI